MRSLNHTATGNKQAIKNKPFDEVLDFSGSEASVDTDARRQRTRHSDDFSSSKSKHIPTKHTNIQQENPSGQYSNHDQLTQIIRTSSSNPKVCLQML